MDAQLQSLCTTRALYLLPGLTQSYYKALAVQSLCITPVAISVKMSTTPQIRNKHVSAQADYVAEMMTTRGRRTALWKTSRSGGKYLIMDRLIEERTPA